MMVMMPRFESHGIFFLFQNGCGMLVVVKETAVNSSWQSSGYLVTLLGIDGRDKFLLALVVWFQCLGPLQLLVSESSFLLVF